MYMLEGASRWNVNQGRQAVDMGGTSLTKIYDVRLMSHMNVLSNRVLGCSLLPKFIPPEKPTDERIAVEYLLAQSDRGDLFSPLVKGENTLPEMQVEVQEDECLDVTISDAADINVDAHTLGCSSSHDDSLISSLVMEFPIPQAIVMTYSHIKQLLEDCRELLNQTNLVLVTMNNTTVSSW